MGRPVQEEIAQKGCRKRVGCGWGGGGVGTGKWDGHGAGRNTRGHGHATSQNFVAARTQETDALQRCANRNTNDQKEKSKANSEGFMFTCMFSRQTTDGSDGGVSTEQLQVAHKTKI